MVKPNNIRAVRERLGLSQAFVAEGVGTSAQQIARLETGSRRLTIDWANRIATTLGVHPYELMFPEGAGAVVSARRVRLMAKDDFFGWPDKLKKDGPTADIVGLPPSGFAIALRADGPFGEGEWLLAIDPEKSEIMDFRIYAVLNEGPLDGLPDGDLTPPLTIAEFKSNPARFEPFAISPDRRVIKLDRDGYSVLGRVTSLIQRTS